MGQPAGGVLLCMMSMLCITAAPIAPIAPSASHCTHRRKQTLGWYPHHAKAVNVARCRRFFITYHFRCLPGTGSQRIGDL